MSDTPQDIPQDDPSSPVDPPTAQAIESGDSVREQAEEATSSESKKPWWKFWG
jgi:hypothetical protein